LTEYDIRHDGLTHVTRSKKILLSLDCKDRRLSPRPSGNIGSFFVKFFVKLCAERAPKTPLGSALSSRKQTYSTSYTPPVNRRVVGSSPTSGAILINNLLNKNRYLYPAPHLSGLERYDLPRRIAPARSFAFSFPVFYRSSHIGIVCNRFGGKAGSV